MFVVLGRDHGEVLEFASIVIHVHFSCISEKVGNISSLFFPITKLNRLINDLVKRVSSVRELSSNNSGLHFLKSEAQDAVIDSSSDQVAAQMEGWAAGGTVVADVVDGDSGHSHFIDGSE